VLRIISWNMNHYGRWGDPSAAWNYLRNIVKPDVALLQEAILPSYTDERTPRWGTAIYANPDTVHGFSPVAAAAITKEYLADLTDLGKTVIADITFASGHTYTLVSIHIDTARNGRLPIVTDWPEVDHLNALFDAGKLGKLKSNFIIGGDFNADSFAYPVEHKPVFDRLESLGYHECSKEHENTYFGYKRKSIIQDDHFFIHRAMTKSNLDCTVRDYEEVARFSDHAIIELEIDL
jgi:hypothetical protein